MPSRERGVDGREDVLARQAASVLTRGHGHEDLGGDDHLVAAEELGQQSAGGHLAGPARVGVGGVEEGDPALDRRLDDRLGLLLVDHPRALAVVAEAHHAHAQARTPAGRSSRGSRSASPPPTRRRGRPEDAGRLQPTRRHRPPSRPRWPDHGGPTTGARPRGPDHGGVGPPPPPGQARRGLTSGRRPPRGRGCGGGGSARGPRARGRRPRSGTTARGARPRWTRRSP